MRKWIISLVLISAIASGVAFAQSDNHTTPGTPGDPNCAGQSAAFLAQVGPTLTPPIKPGLGNLARALDITVQDIHDAIEVFCNTP
jgi:hypothetical protein